MPFYKKTVLFWSRLNSDLGMLLSCLLFGHEHLVRLLVSERRGWVLIESHKCFLPSFPRELKEKIQPEILELIKQQRLNRLVEGTCFRKLNSRRRQGTAQTAWSGFLLSLLSKSWDEYCSYWQDPWFYCCPYWLLLPGGIWKHLLVTVVGFTVSLELVWASSGIQVQHLMKISNSSLASWTKYFHFCFVPRLLVLSEPNLSLYY